MSSTSSSNIAWIVGTLSEREEVLALLQDDNVHEPRDELGMAALRDVISDALFPGVTTLQTRAKYFLFVPAMYERIEDDPVLRRRPADSIRQLEAELLAALLLRHRDDGQRGIIGERFKRPPNNPSSGIYWRGLSTWSIRRFHNTRAQYHAWLRQPTRKLEWHEIEEGVDETASRWRARDLSHDVLAAPSLELRAEEARFLQECVLRLPKRPDRSLMTDLLGEDVRGCSAPWRTAVVLSGRAAVADLALDAERVSAAVRGAMVLYNLLCARQFAPAAADPWADDLETWRREYPASWWNNWDLDDFWGRIEPLPYGRSARRRTDRFIGPWIGLLQRNRVDLSTSRMARDLIVRREHLIKPQRERLSAAQNQQNWSAQGIGAEPLTFRWPRAKQMLIDMSVSWSVC